MPGQAQTFVLGGRAEALRLTDLVDPTVSRLRGRADLPDEPVAVLVAVRTAERHLIRLVAAGRFELRRRDPAR